MKIRKRSEGRDLKQNKNTKTSKFNDGNRPEKTSQGNIGLLLMTLVYPPQQKKRLLNHFQITI